jgi:hypothetical protein
MDASNEYFFDELPSDYEEIRLYDTESKKFRLITGPVSFVISLAAALLIFFLKINFSFDNFVMSWQPLYLLHILTIIVFVLIYTALHELTHGIVYGLYTHRKLRFGISGSFAYCGVPGIYVKRNVAAASCIAQFVIFTVLFAVLLAALPVSAFWFVVLVVFMDHIGGCFADIYAFAALIKNGKELLVLDNGKDQHIFVKNGRAPYGV